jgi:hypothetical protein
VEFASTLCEGSAASTGLDSGEVNTPLWCVHEEEGEAFVAVGTLVVHTSRVISATISPVVPFPLHLQFTCSSCSFVFHHPRITLHSKAITFIFRFRIKTEKGQKIW